MLMSQKGGKGAETSTIAKAGVKDTVADTESKEDSGIEAAKEQGDKEVVKEEEKLISKPKGKAPKGKAWDGRRGEWVSKVN